MWWQEYAQAECPFQGYQYCMEPGMREQYWCGLHDLAHVRTRMPLMPLLTYDAEDYTEELLFDCTDVQADSSCRWQKKRTKRSF